MTSGGNYYARVEHRGELDRLMEVLYQPGGASIVPEGSKAELPVVLEPGKEADTLQLNMTAIRKHVGALLEGKGFRLIGGSGQGMVRTPVLTITRTWEHQQGFYGTCGFPEYLEKMQRRESFRASLRRGMVVRVDIHDDTHAATGTLRDISMRGCQAALPAIAVMLLREPENTLTLELTFPDGTRFTTPAQPRHQSVENDTILCGFLFDVGHQQQQQLWKLVRETEREAARDATSDRANLRPSTIYVGDAVTEVADGEIGKYRTPVARRLARHADFLSIQFLQLRHGGQIDSTGLSRHAEGMLELHAAGREKTLFALACLDRELPVIQHGLAVAVRMLDMVTSLDLPRDLLKALVAAAMVHDLGKALLPERLTEAKSLDRQQVEQLQQHVAWIMRALEPCPWVASAATEAMIECINERLDGSGYPDQRGDSELPQLARLAAVIDVIDAMGRDRADRPAMPVKRIYAHLLQSPKQFDPRWVKRYITHFGRWPVGTLVRFAGGELGWVLSLDEATRLKEVRVVSEIASADTTDGTSATGDDLLQLGQPVETVVTAP